MSSFALKKRKSKYRYYDDGETDVGAVGEAIAVRYLEKKSYRLIHRNWRCKWGEIDAVFQDEHAVVVVEVKTRFYSARSRFHVFDNIGSKKRRKLRLLADIYLSVYYGRRPRPPVRIDLVGVYLDRDTGRLVSIEHARSAV